MELPLFRVVHGQVVDEDVVRAATATRSTDVVVLDVTAGEVATIVRLRIVMWCGLGQTVAAKHDDTGLRRPCRSRTGTRPTSGRARRQRT